ncbi:MAG: penicillin-binding protein 2 [Myxococcota bacterium]
MTWKLVLLGLVLVALLGLGWFKAGVLQLARGEALRELSRRQSVRHETLSGFRGSIYDRRGRLLAMSAPVWSAYAHPPQVKNVDRAAAALAPILQQSPDAVRSRLRSSRPFVWLAHALGPGQAERIRDAGLPAVGAQRRTRRFYPNHTLLGQLLGSVSLDTGHGLSGVERAADALLRGTEQYRRILVDALGRPLRGFVFSCHSRESGNPDRRNTGLHGWLERFGLGPRFHGGDGKSGQNASNADLDCTSAEETVRPAPPSDGRDLRLTIDVDVQHAAEQALLQAVQKHHAKGAWAIVMDVRTGDLLSVAQAPFCNPNAPDPRDVACRNRGFFDAVEPGSVFKVVTLAAMLEQGVAKPHERIFCGKKGYRVGRFVIRDVAKREWATVQEAFVRSINTGIIRTAERMDRGRFEQTIRRLGFGRRTDLGFAEEAAGRVPPARGWGKARFANITMGYGLTATSLQLVRAAATIANGGTPVKPRLYRSSLDLSHSRDAMNRVSTAAGVSATDNRNMHNAPAIPPAQTALASKAARQLTAMMEAVASRNGPGRKARIPGVRVAVKTGTAEKVDARTGTYDKRRNRSLLLGFAPAENPRIAAIVTVDEPAGASAYGGDVAAPPWRRIVEAALARPALACGGLTSP